MTNPAEYRPKPGTIPTSPGVYRFRDPSGRVVYVGKAVNLRQRLQNYFQDLSQLHPRTRMMVTTAASVEWTVVRNEVEALILEHTWIKKYDPRFNVVFKDDKSYPYLAVTMNEEFPRMLVMRGDRKPGVQILWPVRESVGHPRDRRHTHQRDSHAHVRARDLQEGPATGPAVPARIHRQVLRTVRWARDAG